MFIKDFDVPFHFVQLVSLFRDLALVFLSNLLHIHIPIHICLSATQHIVIDLGNVFFECIVLFFQVIDFGALFFDIGRDLVSIGFAVRFRIAQLLLQVLQLLLRGYTDANVLFYGSLEGRRGWGVTLLCCHFFFAWKLCF